MEKLSDYITKKPILITPEQLVKQNFAKILHVYFLYSKKYLITNPEYRVSQSPSADETKLNSTYPLDLVVLKEGMPYIIIETKSISIRNLNNATIQFKKYLNLCEATYGIVINGKEIRYFRKRIWNNKFITEEIDQIPYYDGEINELNDSQNYNYSISELQKELQFPKEFIEEPPKKKSFWKQFFKICFLYFSFSFCFNTF